MRKLLSVVAYLGMVGGIVGQIATRNLFSSAPLVIAAQAGAFVLLLWARVTFGRRSFHVASNPTEGGLVTSGPYRFIRHPIYTSMCLLSAAGAGAHWSLTGMLCFLLLVGCALVRIFCEEAMVLARYPEYRQYAAKTWRMVPYIF